MVRQLNGIFDKTRTKKQRQTTRKDIVIMKKIEVLINTLISQHHPTMVAYGCSIAAIFLGAWAAFNIIHMYMQWSYRKKNSRLCEQCKGKTTRTHIKMKLTPDLSGSWFRRFMTQFDCLCQTHASCENVLCPGHTPYVEYGKEYIRPFGPISRFFRWREFRMTVGREGLINTPYVRNIFRDRKDESAPRPIFRPAPLDRLPAELKPTVPDFTRPPRKVT